MTVPALYPIPRYIVVHYKGFDCIYSYIKTHLTVLIWYRVIVTSSVN